MAKPIKVIKTMLRSLVRNHFGCLDATAATINDENGSGVCKGTLSKRMNSGSWPLHDIIALEDVAGDYPVTRWMARRLTDVAVGESCLMTLTATSSREAGEAHAAALRAIHSQSEGDKARAVREAREGLEAMQRLVDGLEAQ
ncbi:MAG: hypothetical protein ACPGSI_17305 [Pikeienuella sp.]